MNRAQGGTYAGLLSALNALLDIAVPDDLMEGGTYIVPGHGRICDEADLVEYRDMAYQIRDRLEKLAADGKTLAEARAARPVIGWEGRYSQPGWTTDGVSRRRVRRVRACTADTGGVHAGPAARPAR